MQLSYRGVHHRYQPTPTDMVESGVTGHYRGQQVNFSYPRHIPVPQPVMRMQYRGVKYCTTPAGGTEAVPQTQHPEMAAGDKAVVMPLPPITQVKRFQSLELSTAHLDNIRKRLEHRMEVAKAKGDLVLLNQLEQERSLFV